MKLRLFAAPFATLAFLALPAWGQSCYTNPTTLIVNCGFETGDFTDWNTEPAWLGSAFGVINSGYQSNHSAAFAGLIYGYYDDINQLLPTIAGNWYYLDFEVMGHGNADAEFIASWDGIGVYPAPYTSFGWTDVHVPVFAVGGDILRFESFNVPSFFYLDNVSVTTPTPEPGSQILLGSGLLGLAGVAHRKFNL